MEEWKFTGVSWLGSLGPSVQPKWQCYARSALEGNECFSPTQPGPRGVFHGSESGVGFIRWPSSSSLVVTRAFTLPPSTAPCSLLQWKLLGTRLVLTLSPCSPSVSTVHTSHETVDLMVFPGRP